MAGYDDYQTEEEYVAAQKLRSRLSPTGERVEAVAWQRAYPDGAWSRDFSCDAASIAEWESWGFESRPLYSAATLAALEAERGAYRDMAARKSNEKVSEFKRAEAAETALAAANARVAELTKERDAQYAENVERIAKEGAAILRAGVAEARMERLEKALKPFAVQADTFDSCGDEFVPDEFEPAIVGHTIGDLRAARAALTGGENGR